MPSKRVFVTDARSIAALAVARSLGDNGLAVSCGESSRPNPTFFSRYVRRRMVHRDPSSAPDEYLADLEELLCREEYEALIPVGDATTSLLVRDPERFSRFTGFCVPDCEAFAMASDKGKTVEAALEYGVSVPKTFFPEKQSLESIAASIRYPALIKPRVSSGARGIVFVENADELFRSYPRVEVAHGVPIVQEYIADDRQNLGSAFLFNREGQLRAAYAYVILRQFPVRGGSTTYGVTTDLPDVVQCGSRFLHKLGWRGVAQANFARDPKDGELKLIEVNPRFWTSVSLGMLAGVDMPYLLYRIITEGDVEPVNHYRAGCYHRWLLPSDILWFANVEKSWKNIRAFLRVCQPDLCYRVCSASDPLPAVGAGLQAADFLTRRSRRDFVLKRGWKGCRQRRYLQKHHAGLKTSFCIQRKSAGHRRQTERGTGCSPAAGHAGLQVTCGEPFRCNPTFFSRYVRMRILYANPEREPVRFLAGLEAELRSAGYRALVPIRSVRRRFSSSTANPLQTWSGCACPIGGILHPQQQEPGSQG